MVFHFVTKFGRIVSSIILNHFVEIIMRITTMMIVNSDNLVDCKIFANMIISDNLENACLKGIISIAYFTELSY